MTVRKCDSSSVTTRVVVLFAVLCSVVLLSNSAAAQATASTVSDQGVRKTPELPARAFALPDYLATASILGGYYAIEFTQSDPRGASWTKPVPGLDRGVRNLLVASTRHGREQADRASDWFWYGSVAYPTLVAPALSAARGRGLASSFQMTMMNVQAFAVTSLFLRAAHKWVGRSRPNTLGCAEDPNYDSQCSSDARFASFPSGHAGISMTGAGLSCAHHIHGKLLGDSVADAAACAAAVGAAGAVGVLRIRADRHWVSDTLIGSGFGFAVGYLLPTVLYYKPFWQQPTSPSAPSQAATRWTILPMVTQNSASLSVSVVHL